MTNHYASFSDVPSVLPPDNPYARAFADLCTRLSKYRISTPDALDDKLQEGLDLMPGILEAIIPHYRSPEHIHHCGGADVVVAFILMQTLGALINWPDDYRGIAMRYRKALNLPQHMIDCHLQATTIDAHYTP